MKFTKNTKNLIMWIFLVFMSIPWIVFGILLFPEPPSFFFLFFSLFCIVSGFLLRIVTPIVLDENGIRRRKISFPWEKTHVTVHFQYYRGGVDLIAYVCDRYLSVAQLNSRNQLRGVIVFSLSPQKLSELLAHTPNVVFYANGPQAYPSGIRRMVRMIDDHNRSVSEKQKEMNP